MVNITVMRSETDRIRQLASSLTELATGLSSTDPASWTGAARAGFVENRDKQAGQCLRAAEAHSSASKTLNEYVQALTALEDFDRFGGNPQQRQKLAVHLDEATHAVTRALRQAREELTALHATLGEIITPVPVPELSGVRVVPAEAPYVASSASIARVLDPNHMHRDLSRFDRDLQQLSDAMLDFWSGTGDEAA
jgi:hypothetical protein